MSSAIQIDTKGDPPDHRFNPEKVGWGSEHKYCSGDSHETVHTFPVFPRVLSYTVSVGIK